MSTPKALDSSRKKKLISSDTKRSANDSVRIPQDNYDMQPTYESALREHLISIRMILMKYAAFRAGQTAPKDHIQQRAREAVEEDVSRNIIKLSQLQGPNQVHRVSALALLSAQLNTEVERLIFTDERSTIQSTITESHQRKLESEQKYVALTKDISTQQQVISDLGAKIDDLEAANRMLSRSSQAIQRELEIAARNQSQTSQFCVELRMQGLDYKAEVDRRASKILASVQSRLGFIPSCIQKQAAQMHVLKPPGDPHYEEVREKSYSRSKTRKLSTKLKKSHSLQSDRRETSAPNPRVDLSAVRGAFVPWANSVLLADSSLRSDIERQSGNSESSLASLKLTHEARHVHTQSPVQTLLPGNIRSGPIPSYSTEFRDRRLDSPESSEESESSSEFDDAALSDDSHSNSLSNQILCAAEANPESLSVCSGASPTKKPLQTNDDWVHWALSAAEFKPRVDVKPCERIGDVSGGSPTNCTNSYLVGDERFLPQSRGRGGRRQLDPDV